MNKFSIILATYNAELLLDRTILSILNQTYQEFELIVIDGNSSDKTIEILNKYSSERLFWFSEKDEGIYDAWNKGIAKSNYKWILFIGAGDTLKPYCLEKYCDYLNQNKHELDFISAKVNFVDLDEKIIKTIGKKWNWKDFSKFMNVAHVASIHNVNYFNKYGFFNHDYKIVGDYELLLRAKSQLKTGFINIVQCDMLMGGVSSGKRSLNEAYVAKTTTGGRGKLISNFEYLKAYFILIYRNLF